MNPCGAGVGETIAEAWTKAYEGDKTSIFGGIVAFNREVDLKTAEMLKPIFLEIVMAPSFAPEALDLLCTKKNLRVLKVNMEGDVTKQMACVSVNGGLLVQNQDLETCSLSLDQCVTKAKPTEDQMKDLEFTWKMVKHVKSNAIVVGCGGMLLGVGAGQMNRVGSAEIACTQAISALRQSTPLHPLGGLRGGPLRHPESLRSEYPEATEEGLASQTHATLGTVRGGTVSEANGGAERSEAVWLSEPSSAGGLVLASDAFFPFDDCVTLAAEYGVKAIVQPGGSIRDEDSIKKCDELGIAMLFTGERHFKH